jgi:hypothetical protein
MRTQDDILAKIEELKDSDWMGTTRGDLIDFLEFKNVKQFLKDGITEEQWQESFTENTEDNIRDKMADYLSFAFEKAEGERGLSAGRSMDHYSAWIWLLDEEDHFGDVTDYNSYGIPHLEKIKKYLSDKGTSPDQLG